MTAPPLDVTPHKIVGATQNNGFLEIQPNGLFGFNSIPSSLSYMSGTAAAALGLTQASGAIDSSPGGQQLTQAQFMNNLVQNETSQFGSFQSNVPNLDQALAAWAQSTGGLYQFLSQSIGATPPAGSSLPTTDPAGTYSYAGASAPTPAAPGTYIPVTEATSAAAEIVDPAGTYSLAGASGPTPAQPGYYVPTPGASTETPDDPGYYTPSAGATAELLVQAPVISGTVAGQSTPSGQTNTPFASVTITDPNIDSSDSLSIELTGAGGTLTDSAGFTGLAASAPGVYLLSGTAAAIMSELDALVFTPSAGSGTTTFTLTDTTSLGTSASDANTTVTVLSTGQVVVSVSTFLVDQSTLDETAGGFSIFDTAANITANLDQLNDPNIDAITISDNGQIGPSVQQLTTDATAIGKLQNAGGGAYQLAVVDSASNILAGLSILEADVARIASITATGGTVTVATAIFLADQNALDKIVGGFDVSDTAANVVAKLPNLDADSHVAAITVISGSATLSGGGAVTVANLAETGSGTSLTVSEKLGYAGTFSQGAGSKLTIASADTLSLSGTASLSGTMSGLGALALAGGSDSINGGAKLTVSNWSISGSGTDVTLGEALSYAKSFSEGAGDTLALSGGDLLLSGAATFAGGTVDGSNLLETEGTTTASGGLTIGGTAEWKNTKTVNQSGGMVAIGDSSGDRALFDNTAKGTYDILDNSAVGRGSSTASYIANAGVFEKTGGTGTSTITPAVTNTGTLNVTSGTLDLMGAVTGKGTDTISGASTLEFDGAVSSSKTLGDQNIGFTGGGTLDLTDPNAFWGEISGFAATDAIELLGSWAFSSFSENSSGTLATLTLASGATKHAFDFVGGYTQGDFKIVSGATSTITYT